MPEILENAYILVFLDSSEYVKHRLQPLYSKLSFLLLFGGLKLFFCDEKLFKTFLYLCIYFVQKNSTNDSRKTSVTRKWQVAESCPPPC